MFVYIKHKGDLIRFQIDDDCEIYPKYKWYANAANEYGGLYLKTGQPHNKTYHRLIMGEPKGMYIDHINRDTTDNRRQNLRILDPKSNLENRNKTTRKTSSKYKGVSWEAKISKWRATISVNKKLKHLGVFKSEVDAAKAYNGAVDLYRPVYGNKNIIEE